MEFPPKNPTPVSNRYCSVPQCNSKASKDREVAFHNFPGPAETCIRNGQTVNRRNEWVRVLRIGKKVSKAMLVCSKHFRKEDYFFPDLHSQKRRLKKAVVPSENLPVLSTHDAKKEQLKTERKEQREQRLLQRQKRHESCQPMEIMDHTSSECTESCEEMFVCSASSTSTSAEQEEDTQELLKNLPSSSMTSNVGTQVTSGDFESFKFTAVLTERNVRSMIGIGSLQLLEFLCNEIEHHMPTSSKSALSTKDRVVLTMLVMKHTLSFDFLSHMFGCSPTTCSSVIRATLKALSTVLRCTIYWPTRTEVQNNMPICFQQFSQVRVVLDCTEISVAVPKCLQCAVRTYSHYKGGNTIKYMVGISPGGLITYISKGYGGRSSDKVIFDQSNIVDLLTPGRDQVMVDKGFLIDSTCTKNFITVVRPPFLRQKKQFTKQEALLTKSIASARVHVERAIQRMKIFKILSHRLPWHMVPLADDIVTIAAALTNLSPPILADERFL